MSVHAVSEIVIGRPRTAVAAFASDPRNDMRWIQAFVRVDAPNELPLRAGSQVTRVARFLGREFEYVLKIVEHQPGRRLAMRAVRGPFPMNVTYEFDDVADGTRMRIINSGNAAGFYRLAAPLMSRMVKMNVDKDLARLKAILEATRPSPARAA
ncbi:MAG TPA: SRPBCC family protein [Xanthobacteraceae bacterium]|nr:SRPBCC family protein [Xanthobacteraceae bacterium]